MCLAVFAFQVHARYRLILAANRDEYFARPTAPAAFWRDAPRVLGGRDLQAGGAWLGVTRDGRIGWITNYRDPQDIKPEAPSRGDLVAGYLISDAAEPQNWLKRLATSAKAYNGFNLVLGNAETLYYYSNRQGVVTSLVPGIHGLSNALLNTPWPKLEKARRGLQTIIRKSAQTPSASIIEPLFAMLADPSCPEDAALPDTGVGLALERFLSPIFIAGQDYGTRSSSVVLMDYSGEITFIERTYTSEGYQGTVPNEVGVIIKNRP